MEQFALKRWPLNAVWYIVIIGMSYHWLSDKATSISSTVNTNIETHQLDPNAREHNLAS